MVEIRIPIEQCPAILLKQKYEINKRISGGIQSGFPSLNLPLFLYLFGCFLSVILCRFRFTAISYVGFELFEKRNYNFIYCSLLHIGMGFAMQTFTN